MTEPTDEDIRLLARWLRATFDYIERYPRPSSVVPHLDQIRQHVENLAIKAYKGEKLNG
jgi:hypothetical protein